MKLARKWGGEEFESHLIADCKQNGVDVPAHEGSVEPLAHRKVADFSHHFYFSAVRWVDR